MLASSGAIATFLAQARRRYFWILMLTQSAHAASVALLALILLLFLGTQVLNWYWPVLLFGAGLLFVAWRVWKSLPSSYGLAQVIDAKCGLPDTLSTAWFFHEKDAETAVVQRRQAEETLSDVSLPRVFPVHTPKTAYATIALTLLAGSMIGIRYGTSKNLDFTHPLVPMDLALFSRDVHDSQQAEAKKKKQADALKKYGVPLPNADQPEAPTGTPPETAFKTGNSPEPNGISQTSDKGQKAKEIASNTDPQQSEPLPGEGQDKAASQGDQDQGSDAMTRNAPPQDGKGQKPQQNAQAGQQSNQPGGNNSLLDKMRDAMANLMNKMKSPQQGNDSKQASNNNSQQKNGQPQAANQKGTPTPGSPQSDKAAAADSNDGQAGESDKNQTAQNKPGDKSSPQSSNDSKSGVGAQDGSKDIKNAEQLEAMGKISELIGKRSANVQGEVTIEVSSGKQQLLTPYLKRNATHAEAGSDSNRDEIPLAYQSYVQQYFEQVHRGDKAAKNHASENPAKPRGVSN